MQCEVFVNFILFFAAKEEIGKQLLIANIKLSENFLKCNNLMTSIVLESAIKPTYATMARNRTLKKESY